MKKLVEDVLMKNEESIRELEKKIENGGNKKSIESVICGIRKNNDILREFKNLLEGKEIENKKIIERLEYCRKVELKEVSKEDVIKNDLSSHNLRKIINWTEKNYLNKISIDEVAHIVGYEKHYFCNKFKKLTGISYINYVNNLRIQHACRMLANGNSVSTVCDECGFENLSYFVQLFKKFVGVTPKTYSVKLYDNR